MLIAKVVGEVVASHKAEGITGHKLLLVQPVDPQGQAKGNALVASDAVGAGPGEWVILTQGSSARMTPSTEGKPVDAVIIGILDTVVADGTEVYSKAGA
ncbi:MAG: EutN/CcmL family microcompartment protein [Acidobacteria bacterium]|nr:EutN/CcmL family microcompartment protein [Acidobacteriota bacterium]